MTSEFCTMASRTNQNQPLLAWFDEKFLRLCRWVLNIDRGWKANGVALLIVLAVTLGVDVPW